MAINFPNSPSINDTHTVGGVVYTWDGTVWVVTNALSIQGIQGAMGIQGIQGSGSNITASNVGTVGVGVFKQKTGDNLEFKKLEAGNAVILTDNADSVSIAVPNVPEVDPYWQYVKILHHFNGPDGGTQMLDATQRTWTVVGNAQLDTADKKFGSASLLLDGTGDYIYTAHDPDLSTNTGDFTMEAWIKLAALNRTHMISNKRDSTSAEEHSFQVSSDNTVIGRLWGSGNPQGGVSSISALTTGVWYHVAFCRTGTTLYLFVDGVLQGTAFHGSPTANTGVFHIGRDGFDSSRDFQGWIDEYRFTKGYNRYTSNFTPPTAPFPQGTSIGYFEGLSDVVITSDVSAGSLLYKQADWTNTATSTAGGLTWDPVTKTLNISSLADAGLIIRADTDDVTETDNPYLLMNQDAGGIVAEFGIMGNAGQRASNQAQTFGGSGFNQNDAYIAGNRDIHIIPGSGSTVGQQNAFAFTTTQNWSLEPLRVVAATGNGTNYIDFAYGPPTVLTVRSQGDAVLNLIADTDDVSEDDNPYIFFSQDGNTVTSLMGQCGNVANTLPDGSAATSINANDFTLMQLGPWGMVLGSNRIGMMRFANNGDAIYNWVPYVLPASTASLAYLKIPHGIAPTSPVDGDIWTTTDGLYVRVNGATGQMLLSSRTISTTAPLAGGGDLSVNRTLSINANGISDSLLRQSAARSVIGRSAGTTGNVADITASSGSDGVLRESGGTLSFGTVATAGIANNAVTLGKMAQISTNRILGRVGAGTGDVESLTGTQATTILDTFTTSLKGLVPASGGGTINYLRADGTWTAPPGASSSAVNDGAIVYRAANVQGITNGTHTAVTFDTEHRDDNGYADLGTNNDRFTVPVSGWYVLNGSVRFEGNATGSRIIYWRVNGDTNERYGQVALPTTESSVAPVLTSAVTLYLSANDYVQLVAVQSSTITLNLDLYTAGGADSGQPRMSIHRLGIGSSDSFKTMTVTDTDSGYTWSETGSAVAANATSTLTLVSGTDIDIDVDATSKAIRISSTAAAGSGYPPQLGYMGGF